LRLPREVACKQLAPKAKLVTLAARFSTTNNNHTTKTPSIVLEYM
jgi:hypothetical protein